MYDDVEEQLQHLIEKHGDVVINDDLTISLALPSTDLSLFFVHGEQPHLLYRKGKNKMCPNIEKYGYFYGL